MKKTLLVMCLGIAILNPASAQQKNSSHAIHNTSIGTTPKSSGYHSSGTMLSANRSIQNTMGPGGKKNLWQHQVYDEWNQTTNNWLNVWKYDMEYDAFHNYLQKKQTKKTPSGKVLQIIEDTYFPNNLTESHTILGIDTLSGDTLGGEKHTYTYNLAYNILSEKIANRNNITKSWDTLERRTVTYDDSGIYPTEDIHEVYSGGTWQIDYGSRYEYVASTHPYKDVIWSSYNGGQWMPMSKTLFGYNLDTLKYRLIQSWDFAGTSGWVDQEKETYEYTPDNVLETIKYEVANFNTNYELQPSGKKVVTQWPVDYDPIYVLLNDPFDYTTFKWKENEYIPEFQVDATTPDTYGSIEKTTDKYVNGEWQPESRESLTNDDKGSQVDQKAETYNKETQQYEIIYRVTNTYAYDEKGNTESTISTAWDMTLQQMVNTTRRTYSDFIDLTSGVNAAKAAAYISVYPNPASSSTNINLSIDTKSAVSVEVYNLLGEKVSSILNNETLEAGAHTFRFNAPCSGIYLAKVNRNGTAYTEKIIIQ